MISLNVYTTHSNKVQNKMYRLFIIKRNTRTSLKHKPSSHSSKTAENRVLVGVWGRKLLTGIYAISQELLVQEIQKHRLKNYIKLLLRSKVVNYDFSIYGKDSSHFFK